MDQPQRAVSEQNANLHLIPPDEGWVWCEDIDEASNGSNERVLHRHHFGNRQGPVVWTGVNKRPQNLKTSKLSILPSRWGKTRLLCGPGERQEKYLEYLNVWDTPW